MPTDTIYGIVGSVFSKKAVEKIYRVRKREKNKPFIILISSFGNLKKFDVNIDHQRLEILKKLWPGPVSIVLPLKAKNHRLKANLKYLHRGTNSLAFRLPKPRWLRNFLKKSGPLVAPSANLSGKPPAKTVAEAKRYFGDKVDFYWNKGRIGGSPSSVVEIKR